MLSHAPWAGNALEGGVVDAFAGTGALGLEALSRGVPRAVFIENDRTALQTLNGNVGTCRMETRALVVPADATRPPATRSGWDRMRLVFLDPPYNQGLVAPAIRALLGAGWIAGDALVVAEVAAAEPLDAPPLLAERRHGAARLCIWRLPRT